VTRHSLAAQVAYPDPFWYDDKDLRDEQEQGLADLRTAFDAGAAQEREVIAAAVEAAGLVGAAAAIRKGEQL